MNAIPKHAQEGTQGTNGRSHKERLKILNNQKSVHFRLIFCKIKTTNQFLKIRWSILYSGEHKSTRISKMVQTQRVGINKLGAFMKMMAFGASDFFICYNIIVTLSFCLCVICTFCKFIFLSDAQTKIFGNPTVLHWRKHTHTRW